MGIRQHFEAVDYCDPLALMLLAEGEDTDELESFWDAGLARAKSFEPERTSGDMLGASPFEREFH